MKEIDQVIDIALAEVGYLEKSSKAYWTNPNIVYDKTAGAGRDNYTKYAKEMDNLKVYNTPKNGYAWCKVFVDWCMVQSLGLKRAKELLLGFTAGCEQFWDWYKSKGQIYNVPKRGDLVIFGDCDHIGIVEKVANSKIYTIEGNTSNDNILVTNGGAVAKKSYNLNSGYIKGYCRPRYKDESGSNSGNNNSSNETVYPLIQKGSEGKYVRIAQEKLLNKGYKLPKWGADGNFGEETEKAVKELQRDAKIEVDGIVGKDTWKVLNSDFKKPKENNPYPGYLIYNGMQNDTVKKVQQQLIKKGYSCGKWGADGIFGFDTEKAVKAFQLNNNLDIDGIVGQYTWNKLFK